MFAVEFFRRGGIQHEVRVAYFSIAGFQIKIRDHIYPVTILVARNLPSPELNRGWRVKGGEFEDVVIRTMRRWEKKVF